MRAALAAAGVLLAAAAGCTTGSAPGPASRPTAPASVPASTPVPTPATSEPVSTAPATSGSAAPSSSPAKSVPHLPADFCTAAQLQVRVLPGGAIQGYEIAAVQFTNTSTRSCSISGVPGVQLMRNGAVLVTGKAAALPQQLMHLAPGATAEAQIRDHSTCQAPLSDSVAVTGPPGLTHLHYTRPQLQLRGCEVTVHPLAPPS